MYKKYFMFKRQSTYLLRQIKEKEKFYYRFYIISIIISYLFILIFSCYFINLAYTTKKQNYDILCFNCSGFKYVLYSILIYFFLFNIIFYTINEIRFRLLSFKKIRKINIKNGNYAVYFFSILIFIIFLIYILSI